MQEKIKNTKGITLVALIITVIILLILAGVTISLVIGDNGLITKSKQGVGEYQTRAEEEKAKLDEFEQGIKENSTDNEDSKAMKILVNSGEDGIVKLPIGNSEKDFEIDWGDGNTGTKQEDAMIINKRKIASRSSIKIADQIPEEGIIHIYKEKNKEYVIKIRGNLSEINTYDVYSTEEKILKILQWGEVGIEKICFANCTNLTEIALPNENSFKNVVEFNCTFDGCTKLTNISENLFANCSQVTTFNRIFSGCTGITNIPENLFANCSNVEEFWDIFSGCTGITSIPENLFANCPNVTKFNWTFSGCTGITNIPEKLFEKCTNVQSFDETFYKCAGITSIPENLFSNCPNVTSFHCTFEGCSNLANIPENLFAKCSNVQSFERAFEGCSSLKGLPENLFANCPNVTDFLHTFYGCTGLKGNPIKLWSETIRNEKGINENSGGKGCYYNCRELTDYENIPAFWKSIEN